VISIYMTGSLRRDDPLLGGTADIDLYIVHDSKPEAEREVVRLSD
jgi:tRNA nucleotidyltransferase (CCA-adding enzyme)